MQRLSVFVSIVLVVLAGLAATGLSGARAIAQDATPVLGEQEFARGVFAAPLAFAENQEVPALYRIRFAPGSVLFADTSDPSISLTYVESGAITITIKAPIAVTRAGVVGGSPETVAAGTTVMLETGDYFVVPALTEGTFRNDGEEAASLLVSAVIPARVAMPTVGTPAP